MKTYFNAVALVNMPRKRAIKLVEAIAMVSTKEEMSDIMDNTLAHPNISELGHHLIG